MSIQLHITKLCAPRAGFPAQPGPAGLAGGRGAIDGGHYVGATGFGPAALELDGPFFQVRSGDDAGLACGTCDRNSSFDYAFGFAFDYKSFDYNRINHPWRSCFA